MFSSLLSSISSTLLGNTVESKGTKFVPDVNLVIIGFFAEVVLFVISAWLTPYLWSHFSKVSRSKQYEGRAYMASLFHSIWATGVSLYLMWTVRNDDTEFMHRGLYTVDGFALSLACGTICGHCAIDTLYSAIFSKQMDEYNMFWQMLLHHVLFLVAIYGNFQSCIFLPMFWVSILPMFLSLCFHAVTHTEYLQVLSLLIHSLTRSYNRTYTLVS